MKLLFSVLITISIFLFSCGNDNPVTGNNGEGSTVYTLDSASLWQFQMGNRDTTLYFSFNADLDSFYTQFKVESNFQGSLTYLNLVMSDTATSNPFFTYNLTDSSLNNITYTNHCYSGYGLSKKNIQIQLSISNIINIQIPKFLRVKNFQVIKK